MNSQNLKLALESACALQNQLRAAHRDAIDANEQFAELYLQDLIKLATDLRIKLANAQEAAK